MVWFQCEDCGENLKKPKLPNHFRICSAYKFSCIDCGSKFDQQSVQSHTQCISESEKYGPKGQMKAANDGQTKPKNTDQKPVDYDIYVGLSSAPPWTCSLCKTNTTSKQTLMLHAEGKKHKAKARGFYAAQKQSNQTSEPTDCKKEEANGAPVNPANASMEPSEVNQANGTPEGDTGFIVKGKEESLTTEKRNDEADDNDRTTAEEKNNKKKRKHDENSDQSETYGVSNGEPTNSELTSLKKKKKHMEESNHIDGNQASTEYSEKKFKWKKLAVSALKESQDGVMKIKKLQKKVIKAIQESGAAEDKSLLQDMLMKKIICSSKFAIDGKNIRLLSS